MHEGSTQSRWLWCKIRGIAIRFGYAMEYREVDRVSESSLGDSFVDSTIENWRVVCCATQSMINCTWTRCNRAYVACRICPLCCFLAYQLCSEKRINASRMEIIEFTISWRIVRNRQNHVSLIDGETMRLVPFLSTLLIPWIKEISWTMTGNPKWLKSDFDQGYNF